MTSRTAHSQQQGLIPLLFAAGALVAAALLAPQTARAGEVTDKFKAYASESTTIVDHSAWTALLAQYVIPDGQGLNLVNYGNFKATGQKELKAYITQLEGTDPSTLARNEQFAFWANLYNAKTIDIVLDHYPVKSIRKISLETGLFSAFKKSVGVGGPWDTPVVTVSAKKLSLNDIEHQILRPIFKDPRVHYAVNCASIGCPNLGTEAFSSQQLEAQLDANATAYINHPRGVKVDGDNVVASSIYSWFQSDFGGNESSLLDHLRKYASEELKAELKDATSISDFTYDWNLNDSKK